MQGGRGGRDPFFEFGGDPFGGFGGHKSLLSNFFNGRDPFDDPFFTRPFDRMFESSFFGPGHNPFPDMHPSGFIEQQAPEPKRPSGPIIQELDSDDEKEMKENSRKHGRSKDEPHVEVPDDETEQSERRNGHLQYMNGYNGSYQRQQQPPQTRSFTFQSSTVTYGGANGAYYTSSKTRRSGSDGITFEESKEANTATGQASHRVSRGLHDKGHSVTRKLNSDGRVETMQALHNLNEGKIRTVICDSRMSFLVLKKLGMEMLESICLAGLEVLMSMMQQGQVGVRMGKQVMEDGHFLLPSVLSSREKQ
uniref:Uncharacterized protein n=1 Tax=Gossypium raimondii TaxID=29730 RepID=A0A0D2QUP5_GOSRA|nr:hypothetical protein B456_003G166700 [Gossypium raimondii]